MTFVEHDLIPFSAEPLFGERVLVLAPHPDDEVIGCGGLVALHAKQGRRVHVIVATDGSQAERGGMDKREFAALRERETNAGLAHLGAPPAEFLRIPDRELDANRESFQNVLRERILEIRPDLLVLPSPIEIHPDHRALSLAAIGLLQRDLDLSGALAICRIAFMEITQPIRPTILVDITEVAELKHEAIEKHASQQGQRNYSWFSRGLSQYRTMTLATESRHAEAFHVVSPQWLRTSPVSALESALRGAAPITVEREELPVTVLVRTLNRPRLLRDALHSIRAGSQAPIVVVNDGGESVAAVVEGIAGVAVIDHPAPRGRSVAMNEAVERAATDWIAFLDDDDLYYAEHLATLTRAATSLDAKGWYTDAVSSVYTMNESGASEPGPRLRTYAKDFDADLLLFDNYIPLPTLLLRKADFKAAGGFDPAFDLFEDWDFIIRLSRLGRLVRVPRVTCEIRHFADSGSSMLSNPVGSTGYRDAKLAVWRKHGVLDAPERVFAVLEQLKERAARSEERLQEEIGRGSFLERAIAELERDKETLIREGPFRAAEKEELQRELEALQKQVQSLETAVATLESERLTLQGEKLHIQGEAEEARIRAIANAETVRTLYAEIARLNALITEMHGTRAWKLHRTVERIRGRR
jgi:LmbE family N-acetylglucosaminyl deacetylase/GT2 family glycosyltransferase